MELSNNRFYKINSRLLCIVGYWPYQNRWFSLFSRYYVTFALCSLATTVGAKLIEVPSLDTFIEIVPYIFVLITCLIKINAYYFRKNQMRQLLERICTDWKVKKTGEETKILEAYAEEGRLYTILYSCCMYTVLMIFVVTPLMPITLDILQPLNESRLRNQILSTYHFVDGNKYYFQIYLHITFCLTIVTFVIIASDTMFIVFANHVSGLLAVVGYQLESLLGNQANANNSLKSNTQIYLEKVKYSIQYHLKAIEFVDIMESVFSKIFIIVLFDNVGCLSLTLVQIIRTKEKFSEVIKFIIFAFGQLFHLLCMCYPGQKIIDHSVHVRELVYNGRWYEAPVEVQKMLILVICRSSKPCILTAGKTFVFCLESFASVVQVSMSYYTFMVSAY